MRARRGESFEMPERIVTVHRFEQLWREPRAGGAASTVRAGYAIECGSGTYVRSLIADLGDAYCLELRRTAIGPFDVARRHALPPRGSPGRPAADRLAGGAAMARHARRSPGGTRSSAPRQ